MAAGQAAPVAHPLADWRAAEGLDVKAAGRRLRISAGAVEAIEAGTMQPGPALTIDLFQRTGGAVWVGPALADGADALALGEAAAAERGPVGRLHLHDDRDAADTTEAIWWARALHGEGPLVWLRRQDAEQDDAWTLSAQAAATLGMQLIRAALIANRLPGDR